MDSHILEKTVADRVADALVRHQVKYLFAQSLPSAVVLAAEARGICQISYRQENMGGAMADGYARMSGKVGVVAAQNGPAATLLVPPLAEAMKASVPIVALVQEVERDQADRNAFQELDHVSLFQSCTKWVRRIQVENRIDDYVDAAFTAASSGRPGPVALLLPADLLRSKANASGSVRVACLGHYPLDRLRPTDSLIEQAADWLVSAQRPVVLAGGGVHGAGASQELARLQDMASLPVATTNMGKGSVDEHHSLSLGVLGSLTGPASLGKHTVSFLANADLVVLVGTRTNQNGTDNWSQIPPAARLIHIDIDPSEIGRNFEALRLAGDARETLCALNAALVKRDLSQQTARRAQLEAEIALCWQLFETARKSSYASARSPIRPERVMGELQPWLNTGLTVVADASYSSMWVTGQLRAVSSGTRFITPRGLAGLGWGLPLAIGAKLARPDKPVVALVGDGGFAHSWAELETLVRMKIPVTVIVLNNGILGFQRDAENVKFGRYTTACHFAPVDHSVIAAACGCQSVRIADPEALAQQIRNGIEADSPYLIEVMTDPEAHPPLSLFAKMDQAA
ncbi:acetolactate synthase catalytic subunit [Rhizobium glycinendophyticum]|uniref:Acetolactate synthase catalytic subunit n=2 Tax=Rhizobium glycinendophyticum TaxID=2589807 RepID=A0A504U3I3_9HYPH|nr:acetolactate synthase catalytic subunit [Rhizobium glycinendophyticum]TPP04586.1 acetolactate synthase catalytic subunit [Rhizobium glycinendophyticum]